jgi:hypothetical protein
MRSAWLAVMVTVAACGSSVVTSDTGPATPPDAALLEAGLDGPSRIPDAGPDAPSPTSDAGNACATASADLAAALANDTACDHDEDCGMTWGAGTCNLAVTLGNRCFLVGNVSAAGNDPAVQAARTAFYDQCSTASCNQPGVSCLFDCGPAQAFSCNAGHCQADRVASCFGSDAGP